MMNAWKKFRRTLSAFRIAQAGNVAITFAFASLPIVGFVGAAVDYSRANSVKAAMQTALDSTALMLAKEAATDTEDQLKTNATKYFKALFRRSEARDVDVRSVTGPPAAPTSSGDSRPRCRICEGSWV
jgi:Flp pilus assembly protein TadG